MPYSHRTNEAFRSTPSPPWRPQCGYRGFLQHLTRREICALLVAGGVIVAAQAAPVTEAHAAPTVAQARRFIQQAGDSMIGLLNEPGDWNAKRRKLEAVIAEKMDVDGLARFALGRFWRAATPAQREELIRLFPVVLLGELARSVGILQGITFTIDRGVQHQSWVEVWTTVYRPGTSPRQVEWLVGMPDGKERILDILAEGSSLRITQREDIVGFMAQNHHSVDRLLDALRRKASETPAT